MIMYNNEIKIFIEKLQFVENLSDLESLVKSSLYLNTWDEYSLLIPTYADLKIKYEKLANSDLEGKVALNNRINKPMCSLSFSESMVAIRKMSTVQVSKYSTLNTIIFQGTCTEIPHYFYIVASRSSSSSGYFRIYDLTNKRVIVECEINNKNKELIEMSRPEFLSKGMAMWEIQVKNGTRLYSLLIK